MELWNMSHIPDNSISRNWIRETSIRTTPQRTTVPDGKFLSKHFSDKRSRQVLIGKTPTRLWFCPQAGLELLSAPGASGTLSGSLLLLLLPVSSAGCCWLVQETPATHKGSPPWVLETPPVNQLHDVLFTPNSPETHPTQRTWSVFHSRTLNFSKVAFMVDFVMLSWTGPVTENNTQAMTLPPPCFSVGGMLHLMLSTAYNMISI